MKLKPWTFLKQFLTKNIIILVILSNIIPVFYFFLCIHYNKFAVDSIIYNLSQFTSIQIKFFLFYGVFYGLVLINNILLKKNINTMTNQFVNECLLKFNNKKNYNENLIFTLFNNLKNNYKNFFQDGVNFVGNISMIFTVNYIIYQFNVPYLLWSFIGFFVIKVIFNFYLYKKNLFIEKSNHYQNKSNNYWNNIIENYNLLKMFNCKKLIINNLEVKQNEAIKYENLSNIFKEILDFVFNNLDIFQWVINNILIFKFTPQQYLLARLFNIGLINWFYRDLLIKINYQLPALINYYQLLAINYNDLLENEEITKESPLINLNGNYNIAIKELTIDHQVILKNIFIDINNIKIIMI